MSSVIVIGGGAAGMMAAYAAAKNGHQVQLLEKNEKLGEKVYITGKGRCNVTNACDMEKLFESIVTNPKFMYSAFYSFSNEQLMQLLEEAGCRLKTERGERVFPVSDHASDVIVAMERLLKKSGVKIRLQSRVEQLICEEEGTRIAGVKMSSSGEILRADAVILATGGLSYPSTGSTGEGMRMAEQTGHAIKECRPALVPLETEEAWCRSLQGLSLKNVKLTMTSAGRKVYEEQGEMLFTHFGVSGPLVLSASSFLGKCKDKEQIYLTIDLKPALNVQQLDKRVLRDFQENINKQFGNVLGGLFPAKLIPVVVEQSGIPADKRVHEITREEREKLLSVTKGLTMRVTGTRDFAEAIITQGGISVKEVNPSTMESKKIRGLFFAGEILDVDALTGGFNLQVAWSTGYLAGQSVLHS